MLTLVFHQVPPIIIAMVNNKTQMEKYDQSSVSAIFTGSAPLGSETASALQRQKPSWKIRQGYGMIPNFSSCVVLRRGCRLDGDEHSHNFDCARRYMVRVMRIFAARRSC